MPVGTADDIVTGITAVTTPADHPLLHRWDTDPSVRTWTPAQVGALHLQVAESLRPAFAAVVGDHLDFGERIVLEGDYLLPDLVDGHGSAVLAIVVDEPDVAVLQANYDSREPGEEHRFRAEVSRAIAGSLTHRASVAGVPVVTARPWGDAVARVHATLFPAATGRH